MTGRLTGRDLDTARLAYLAYKMEHHLEAAEKARDDYKQWAAVDEHRTWARTYAAVLTAKLAFTTADRLAPPPGEAVRPAPAAVSPAARESTGGVVAPPGAGVQLRSPAASRTHTAPATASASRPGTGS